MIYGWIIMNYQNHQIQNAVIILTTSCVLVVISFLLLYGFRHDKRDHEIVKCILILLTIIICPLLFTSGMIFSINIIKQISVCPAYTFPMNVNISNSNQTICVCKNTVNFQYTILGKNVLGSECCDCGSNGCGNCNSINGLGNGIGIICIILSIS